MQLTAHRHTLQLVNISQITDLIQIYRLLLTLIITVSYVIVQVKYIECINTAGWVPGTASGLQHILPLHYISVI